MENSVMDAEVQSLILGFDFSFLIKTMVEEKLCGTMKIEGLIYSRTVVKVVSK